MLFPIYQQHIGLHGQGTGYAEALLLATREEGALLVEHILHLVPNGSLHLQAGDKLLLISER